MEFINVITNANANFMGVNVKFNKKTGVVGIVYPVAYADLFDNEAVYDAFNDFIICWAIEEDDLKVGGATMVGDNINYNMHIYKKKRDEYIVGFMTLRPTTTSPSDDESEDPID
jgi:hypothetical protein